MENRIVLVLSFFLCVMGFQLSAQDNFAVIKDPDGYVNVRKAGIQSEIVGQLFKYQPFDWVVDEENWAPKQLNMVYVEYDKYSRQMGSCFRNDDQDTSILSGYIHKSRVYRLEDMPRLKQIFLSENKAVFANDTLTVDIRIGEFNRKKHVMRDSEGKQIKVNDDAYGYYGVETVDGEKAWATDGGVPNTEIKSITVIYKGKTLAFPANCIKNIFEPNIASDYTRICIGPDGEIYIWMLNSDGAGSYNVIWVITDGEVKYMFTSISWYA